MLILKHPHQYLCYLTCILPRYVQLPNLFSELFYDFFFHWTCSFFFCKWSKYCILFCLYLYKPTLLFCSITLFFRWKFSLLFIQIMLNFVEENLLPYYMSLSIFCRKHALDVYSYFTFMSEWLYILNYTCVLNILNIKVYIYKKTMSCLLSAQDCVNWTTSQLDKMKF